MDSDSIFYLIFMGGVVFFSFLNSMKKAKAEKEKREQTLRNQPPTLPQSNSSSESEQFDDWFNQPEPQPEPQQPITTLSDLIKALSPPKPPQMPKARAATAMPKVPTQPAQQRSIAIEPPEMEGQRATTVTTDDAYSQPTDQLPSSSHDWRRAIIAHEILKRKF